MNILQEAEEIINGDRKESYGNVNFSFGRIAALWSNILKSKINRRQVGLCMIALKIIREENKHKPDNLIDIAGYAALIEKMEGETDECSD